jgi:methionyl-tRNA formyltransferase
VILVVEQEILVTVRVIFMGTPEFAVPALRALITPPTSGGTPYEVVAVVTQPDRPSGRGQTLTPSPVKVVAQEAGLKVLQPITLRDEAAVTQLAELSPQVMVVAAFGQILRPNVLNLPPNGCINLHASLLPRWRGAAPIAAAIRAGDAETGLCLMVMDAGLDTGPVIARRSLPLTPQHTTGTLTGQLAQLGADLLLETLPAWLSGEIQPQPQANALATLAPRLKKEEGEINWANSALEIERQVRAFDPWPGTFTQGPRGPFKVLKVEVALPVNPPELAPTGLVFKQRGGIYVTTGQGVIRLVTVQPTGKKAMPAEAMLNGQPDLLGRRLGQVELL